MFFPFGLFLLVKTCLLSIHLTNLTIMGLFLSLLGTPTLRVRSISPGKISKSIWLFILFTTTSSVSSFQFSFTPCVRIQFLLEYCSCLSTKYENLLTLSTNPKTFSSKLFIISCFFLPSPSYSSNLAEINSPDSVKHFSCCSPLIWLSFVVLARSKIYFTLTSKFSTQLNKIALQSADSNLSPKTSVSLVEVAELPSFTFFHRHLDIHCTKNVVFH